MMPGSTPQLIFLVIAIISVGLFFLIAMILRSSHRKLNVEYYQTHWLKIENSLRRDNANTYTISIINADKLVDRALRELGYAGQTMAERLKRAENRLSDPEHLWISHRIRNQLVHEQDAAINYNTARRALSAFKQALKDLGAI